MRLFDARGIAEALSPDKEGFTLTRHECGLTATSDMAAEGPGYLESVAGLLSELTGASLVLPQGTGLLKRTNRAGAIGPSRWVHGVRRGDARPL